MSRIIVLVGMMGSGKSAAGRRLAERLGADFLDTDDLVVAVAGKSVRDIFTQDGESAFRLLEERALATALRAERDTVIAAAGGVVLSERNRSEIAEHSDLVVWLDADTKTLGDRAGRATHRPLLDGDLRERIATLDAQRRSSYDAVADVRIDTTSIGIDAVVTRILGEIETRIPT